MPDTVFVSVGALFPGFVRERLGRHQVFWRAFSRQRIPMVALFMLIVLGFEGVFASSILPLNPNTMSTNTLTPLSLAHLMGSDYLGRDVMTRVAYGIRASFAVGLAVAAIAISFGLVLGVVAGYYGGWVEHVLMRLADALLIVPGFFLALTVAYIFGGGLWNVVVLLGFTGWPQIARIARAEVLSLKAADFVQSARAAGSSNPRIVFKEILPNALPPVIAMMALLVSYGILSEASLSFLGVGDPNVISLGRLLSDGLEYATTAWWVPTFPGAAIFLLVLLLNICGDGLSVALNPYARQGALDPAGRPRQGPV